MINRITRRRKHRGVMYGDNYLIFILDQLSELDDFTIKKMMGGVGFFRDGIIFGAILGGKFRLKSAICLQEDCGEETNEKYYFHSGMAFCEVPDEVLQDKSKMKEWAEEAFQAALKAGDN